MRIVITGTTSGLGLALARYLLNDGHDINGCGRRGDPLTGHEYSEGGGSYTFRSFDILELKAVSEWAQMVCGNGKPVDILIHNAAVIHENANLWEIDRKRLEAVIDINIKGTFNVLQAFLPYMIRRKAGIIVTLSSGAGRIGIAKLSGYCASKWAVEGLTKCLAEELPGGMAAIPLSPGMVDTDMLRTNFGSSASNHPQPDEWAKVAAPFILSLTPDQNGKSLTVPM